MHNTGNPLGSKDILDLYDNSENIDYFANSQLDEHPDRFGTKRLTLAGLIKRSMALRNEINDFSGALTFKPEWSDVPMNVSEGVGGEGGALNLQAEALGNRSEINKITSREALRRVYQEAGLDLVEGSFEEGAVITSTTDVVLHEKTGKCYSGPVGNVPKGTNPLSDGFVDKTNLFYSTSFQTRASLSLNTSLYIGSVCKTLGGEQPFDGGAGIWIITSKEFNNPDGYTKLELASGLVAVLQPVDGVLNLLAAGANKSLNQDATPIFNSCIQRAFESNVGTILFPACTESEGYVINKVEIPFAINGQIFGLHLKGEGAYNSLGVITRIYNPINSFGIKLSSIAFSASDISFGVYCGSPGTIISKSPDSVTVDRDIFELNDSTPVTWNSTVTGTDGTVYNSGYIQFITDVGAFYAGSLVKNQDGTWTLSNIDGANDTPTSNILNAKRIVRYASRAHFEPGETSKKIPANYKPEAACIFLNTCENPHFERCWFLQVLSCFSRDLGSGGGSNTGPGNIGTHSDIIVDGAWNFIKNTDLTGGSLQSIEQGHFTNLQLFSVRKPFVGRRVRNMTFASLQTAFCDGFITAFDIFNITTPGALFGWGTGSGFEKVLFEGANVHNVNITGCNIGRHHYSSPLIIASSLIGLNMTGVTFETISESGDGAVINIVQPIDGFSTFVRNCFGAITTKMSSPSSKNHIRINFDDPGSVNFYDNQFLTPVLSNIALGKRSLPSGSSTYGYIYDLVDTHTGGFGPKSYIFVESWIPSMDRCYVPLSGVLTKSLTFKLPNIIDLPSSPKKFIVNLSVVNFNTFSVTIENVLIISPEVCVFEWVGEWVMTSKNSL